AVRVGHVARFTSKWTRCVVLRQKGPVNYEVKDVDSNCVHTVHVRRLRSYVPRVDPAAPETTSRSVREGKDPDTHIQGIPTATLPSHDQIDHTMHIDQHTRVPLPGIELRYQDLMEGLLVVLWAVDSEGRRKWHLGLINELLQETE
ncbi:MAG: hypothetical protein ACK5XN_14580, partial [Bacteroidota bacterium]